MRTKIFELLKTLYYIGQGCLWLVKFTFYKHLYSSESYFPELADSRKSKLRIWFEQLRNILKYSAPNRFYFLYGLDIKGLHNSNDFVDYTLFMRRRGVMNHRFLEFPPVPVLRDKALFGIIAEAYGINTPKNIGVIQNEKVYLFKDKSIISIRQLVNFQCIKRRGCFVKKIDGECAEGVYYVEIGNGKILHKGVPIDCDSFFEKNHRYLIQEAILNQHPAISNIYSKAINTLRLVTVYNANKNEVEVFSCVLRVGKGDSQVDNWAAGGLSIGVDTDNGILRKFGFYKPGMGTKVTEHPDSHIVFEGYEIPFMREAIEQALLFHRHLYGIHSIGWDIAITEEGPCFVEGNDNWEISLMQISNYGLQQDFDRLFY